jgi:hypothetical protein
VIIDIKRQVFILTGAYFCTRFDGCLQQPESTGYLPFVPPFRYSSRRGGCMVFLRVVFVILACNAPAQNALVLTTA